MRTLLTILSGALVLGGCGHDDDGHHHHDIDAGDLIDPSSVETEILQLGPGGAVEGVFNAGPGDRIHVMMSAPEPQIDWNIHAHAAGNTTYYIEEANLAAVDYWFEPTDQLEYFLMPQNSSAADLTVTVTVEFYGDATFVAWE